MLRNVCVGPHQIHRARYGGATESVVRPVRVAFIWSCGQSAACVGPAAANMTASARAFFPPIIFLFPKSPLLTFIDCPAREIRFHATQKNHPLTPQIVRR